MNRDYILHLMLLYSNKTITQEEMVILLHNYCLSKGKNTTKIGHFINILMNNHLLYTACSYAVEYFERKFNVNKLYSQVNNTGYRKLLCYI